MLQYENAQNKPAVIAYTGGSVTLLIFAEWLINKPGLNIVSDVSVLVYWCAEEQYTCISISTSMILTAAVGVPHPANWIAFPAWSCEQVPSREEECRR